jgi:phosphoribosylamine--glycine ligase
MKVLIVGGGGREHALAWKVAQSEDVEKVFVAPGNAGTAMESGVENVAIGADDIPALVAFARDTGIGLTIIGPEAPLVHGIVDAFHETGLPCFGPTRAAAALEGSKAFCKDFLRRHRIPTAEYQVFTELEAACAYVRGRGAPLVVKADGLAAGKGVVVAQSEDQALAAVTDMLAGNRYGAAGSRVVIEEFLQGEEASFIVISDGEHAIPLAGSQDHKARDDGDKGPNTGGMGAYSPAPVITPEVHARIMSQVIEPTIDGMAAEGRRYVGFLYAGLMVSGSGDVKVLEYNCRFGDPETQPVMLRLKSDLVGLCRAALQGQLGGVETEWDPRAALGVVMASAGYPASASKGDVITGLDRVFPDGVKVFHAGTAREDDHIVTAGGRVLCVTALGDSVSEAQQLAYRAAAMIRCKGMFYRRDIGYRAVARESKIRT